MKVDSPAASKKKGVFISRAAAPVPVVAPAPVIMPVVEPVEKKKAVTPAPAVVHAPAPAVVHAPAPVPALRKKADSSAEDLDVAGIPVYLDNKSEESEESDEETKKEEEEDPEEEKELVVVVSCNCICILFCIPVIVM